MTTPHQTNLHGKVALITGASSGIGAAMARALAARGAHVALAARRAERVQDLANEIGQGGGQALAITADVRDEDAVKAMVQATVDRFGGIDILIPNAGLGYRASIVDGDTQRWKTMLDTNVYGVLLTLKYGIPHVVARGRGDVFLLSSVAGRVVATGGAGYSATKFAVNAIGEALRQEVSRQGVRVTLLEPGVVVSEFQEVASYPPGIIKSWLGDYPPIQAEDIAQAMLSVLDLPPHVMVNELLIRPTGQVSP
jgi:3-hydroxy acid dehydrogenase/malonic semialdehyde reductase